MTDFYMTVGLPASGKSTWARKFKEENKTYGTWIIIESDKYREALYGSAEVQGDNNKLFEIIHKDILANLEVKASVIFDATNLSYKHRKVLLDKIAKIKDVNKTCILFSTEFSICLERNVQRERHVPEDVIKRMRESFNVPMYTEGWNDIQIEYEFNENNYEIDDYLKVADLFDQENPHHSMTLGRHSRYVQEYMKENKVDEFIHISSLLHDVGKLSTKVFTTIKGDPKEFASYYNHENVSAYESLFYLANYCTKTKEILFGSALINYHMRPYLTKTDKAKKKLKDTVGEDLYYFLEMFNLADIRAH